MDIEKMKSDLQMQNLYFSNFSFSRSPIIHDGKFENNIEREITPVGEHTYSVRVTLSMKHPDVSLDVTANATFSFVSDDYSKEESVITKNTVAIMFPFIRSQVSLMTTQPGMSPVLLPPININKMI